MVHDPRQKRLGTTSHSLDTDLSCVRASIPCKAWKAQHTPCGIVIHRHADLIRLPILECERSGQVSRPTGETASHFGLYGTTRLMVNGALWLLSSSHAKYLKSKNSSTSTRRRTHSIADAFLDVVGIMQTHQIEELISALRELKRRNEGGVRQAAFPCRRLVVLYLRRWWRSTQLLKL